MVQKRLVRRAAILSTGSEIMQGLYADTNAQWLSQRLWERGLEVVGHCAVGDDQDAIEGAVRYLGTVADVIIATGGLGPTEDDLNRFVYAKVFDAELERDERSVDLMRERFTRRGREMPVSNEVQAMIPRGAQVFHNFWGTASGFAVESDSFPAILAALPGVPFELKPMFEMYVEPLLAERAAGSQFVRIRTVQTFGRPESDLNDCTRELFRGHPDVQLTVLARQHGVEFRVCARGDSDESVSALLDKYEADLRRRIGEADVYGIDGETLPEVVGRLLSARKLTITTAESCTGGFMAKLLTDVSGSSDYVKQAVVTYSNDAKTRLLGVKPETLEHWGAVSEQVAREMAEGARDAAGADVAISATGIAGPTGGTDEKPVGLTYIGLAIPGKTIVERHVYLGDRDRNRMLAALSGLNLVRKALQGFA